MQKKAIDQFVQKLTVTIEDKISDYKAFIELQKECVDMLEDFHKSYDNSIDGLRNLGYFRITVKHLLNSYFVEKKRAMMSLF